MSQQTNNQHADDGANRRENEVTRTDEAARADQATRAADATTIERALHDAADSFRSSAIADPRREAATLLAATIERDRAYLFAHSDDALVPAALALFRERVARRKAGEPLQYITGHQEFYGLDFEVSPAVLIPRPETELIVETALELLGARSERHEDARQGDGSRRVEGAQHAPLICDVGTGSGCIAISVLHERREARAVAVDISADALAVAARNAARHSVNERITLVESDLFAALDPSMTFDLIVSNPPYVAERDLADLQREVREHEPRRALTPGGDGLSVIRRLLADAPNFLAPCGHLVFEIGYDQSESVRQLIDPRVWTLTDVRRDLQGIPRTVVLELKGRRES